MLNVRNDNKKIMLDAEQLGGGEHFIYKNNQNILTSIFQKFIWKN